MKKHRIQTMQDIARLTPDELQRFLPDLVAWHAIAQDLAVLTEQSTDGLENIEMLWCDDGQEGIVTSVRIGQFEVLDLLARNEPQ